MKKLIKFKEYSVDIILLLVLNVMLLLLVYYNNIYLNKELPLLVSSLLVLVSIKNLLKIQNNSKNEKNYVIDYECHGSE